VHSAEQVDSLRKFHERLSTCTYAFFLTDRNRLGLSVAAWQLAQWWAGLARALEHPGQVLHRTAYRTPLTARPLHLRFAPRALGRRSFSQRLRALRDKDGSLVLEDFERTLRRQVVPQPKSTPLSPHPPVAPGANAKRVKCPEAASHHTE
jgi:hypothetical protein